MNVMRKRALALKTDMPTVTECKFIANNGYIISSKLPRQSNRMFERSPDGRSYDQSWGATIDRTINRSIVRPIVATYDRSYDRSWQSWYQTTVTPCRRGSSFLLKGWLSYELS